MASSESQEAASEISELQSVFSTLLLASKKVDPVNDYPKGWYRAKFPHLAKATMKPNWTGALKLMDFPREIRDQIYYHYLYRPKGIIYHRKTTRTFPFDDHYEGITSLLLTCRQVYYEAFQIFARYNLVEIRTTYHWHQQRYRDKSMDGMLRLFPDAPARRLQRVGISMEQYSYIYQSYRRRLDPGQDTAPPGAAFIQMLRDAYTFESTFPKLRDFCVTFRGYNNFFGEQYGFMAEGEDDEEKIANCVSVMEMWLGESQVVPPSWFRFWFDEVDWRYPGLREQEGIWNSAYARVVKERAKKVVEVEGSGKRWIEEMSSEDGKKKGMNRA